jgi:hypothetical protein
VNVSFSVSIVSLHLKLYKVCIEPKRNTRRSGEEFLCEKSLGSELSRSLRCKECTGNRSLHKEKIRRNNTSDKCYQGPGTHFPGGAKVETFGDLENLLSLRN